jgi:hypothetical protein
MGKYGYNVESDRKTSETAAKGAVWIANELAEANRLKRLELLYLLGENMLDSEEYVRLLDSKKLVTLEDLA